MQKLLLVAFITLLLPALITTIHAADVPVQKLENRPEQPCIVSRIFTNEQPPLYRAIYNEPKGSSMISLLSGTGRKWLFTKEPIRDGDNQNWMEFDSKPDFTKTLPSGYRRNPATSIVDLKSGRLLLFVNALDTLGLNPKLREPRIGQYEYYLRYRVSEDGGRTWLFDDQIIHMGEYTEKHPFKDVYRGKNAFFLGDRGSIPIITHTGRILVPITATMLDKNGNLWNPSDQSSFTDVFVILGVWKDQGRIEWKASHRLRLDPALSTRGLMEPTLAQFGDGRILMVMRGSNAGKFPMLPSYRWFSISENDGDTWTEPKPWTYEDGTPFFSPSSMSVLIKHSSGRVFWVGNAGKINFDGNLPRWPVVIAEIDPKSLLLIRDTVLEVDTKRPEDKGQGRVDLSHFSIIEDRQTSEFVLTYPRAYGGYRKRNWVMVRIAIAKIPESTSVLTP